MMTPQQRTGILSASVIACFVFTALSPGASALAPVVPGSKITAGASSAYYAPLTAASFTIDGSGMTGDLCDNSSTGNGMWLSASGGGGSADNNPAGFSGPAWLLYQFQNPYRLDQAWVWNHNQANLTDRGLRYISIEYSTDGTTWSSIGNFELTRAPGTPDYPPGNVIDFGGVKASEVLITAATTNGNYGSAYYGLSEIRFYGDELPCTPDNFPVHVLSVTPDTDYDQLLSPRPSGWLGSDVAHSTPLSPTKDLWLFGDTLLGTVDNGARNITDFINNSIGIQDRSTTPPGTMTFYWGPGNSSFFPHQMGTPGQYYWPTAGLLLQGQLFIFCYSIDPGGGLGFSVVGTTLIRVTNPQDPPNSWTQTAYDFGIGEGSLTIHSAIYEEEPYIYFLGNDSSTTGSRYAVLARMTSDALVAGGLAESLEYWTQTANGPAWEPTPDNLVHLFSPGITETDIQYVPQLHRYFIPTYTVFSPTISLVTATSLTGPWTDPACVYNVPEYDEVSFPIISYAARLHPELANGPLELVLSYATNSLGGLSPLETPEGLAIYSPRVVRVELEPASIPAEAGDWWIYH